MSGRVLVTKFAMNVVTEFLNYMKIVSQAILNQTMQD